MLSFDAPAALSSGFPAQEQPEKCIQSHCAHCRAEGNSRRVRVAAILGASGDLVCRGAGAGVNIGASAGASANAGRGLCRDRVRLALSQEEC